MAFKINTSVSGTRKTRGFTIVELLIVIVVIGILAAIVIVAYNGVQTRAQFVKLQSDTRTITNSLEIYKANNNVYPLSIIDCPTPAATNICLTPTSGETYTYGAVAAGAVSMRTVSESSYEITVADNRQVLYTSPVEATSSNEFVQYSTDVAPIINKYGLVKYQISFDIKSANTATNSSTIVYFQNGSSSRHGGLYTPVPVTTSYTRQVVTFTASLLDSTVTQSMLAFYGTYGTGNIPSVKNVEIRLAP